MEKFPCYVFLLPRDKLLSDRSSCTTHLRWVLLDCCKRTDCFWHYLLVFSHGTLMTFCVATKWREMYKCFLQVDKTSCYISYREIINC